MREYNYELFPVLVTRVSDFLSKEQCEDIINYYKDKDEFAPHRYLVGDGTSNHSLGSKVHEVISKNISSCANFTFNLRKHIHTYSERTGITVCDIVNSWISIQNKGSRLIQHKHTGCALSGAIYLNVDYDSSRLIFDSPNPYSAFQMYSQYTKFSQETHAITPEVGDLIIFPSWLSHGSGNEINETDNRTIISFNVNT